MNTNKLSDKKKDTAISPSKNNRSQDDNLHYNLFKPPKYDTEFFYYTEVVSDWVHRK
jgi:hypothetical protein